MNAEVLHITEDQSDLYKRILAFSFDEGDVAPLFAARLARDNGWSVSYAHRVIEEYKKFIFLGVVCDHPVTLAPSL